MFYCVIFRALLALAVSFNFAMASAKFHLFPSTILSSLYWLVTVPFIHFFFVTTSCCDYSAFFVQTFLITRCFYWGHCIAQQARSHNSANVVSWPSLTHRLPKLQGTVLLLSATLQRFFILYKVMSSNNLLFICVEYSFAIEK